MEELKLILETVASSKETILLMFYIWITKEIIVAVLALKQ